MAITAAVKAADAPVPHQELRLSGRRSTRSAQNKVHEARPHVGHGHVCGAREDVRRHGTRARCFPRLSGLLPSLRAALQRQRRAGGGPTRRVETRISCRDRRRPGLAPRLGAVPRVLYETIGHGFGPLDASVTKAKGERQRRRLAVAAGAARAKGKGLGSTTGKGEDGPGTISASRRVEAPSRHRRASSPGEEVAGGLFFDFEGVRS